MVAILQRGTGGEMGDSVPWGGLGHLELMILGGMCLSVSNSCDDRSSERN